MWTYLSYAISGSIVGFSIWDAVRTAPEASTHPHWLRRSGPKLATLLLGLALLGVQAKSNAVAGVEADKKLHQALTDQRDQLTAAFKAGTDQVIKSATGEAEQTRKDAGTETDAIRRQATEQLSQVQGFMLGTTSCPAVMASIVRPSGRPNSLAIFNLDKKLNMHDLSIELTEFGPGELGGPWSTILQQKVINLPLIIPESVRTTAPIPPAVGLRPIAAAAHLYLPEPGRSHDWFAGPSASTTQQASDTAQCQRTAAHSELATRPGALGASHRVRHSWPTQPGRDRAAVPGSSEVLRAEFHSAATLVRGTAK